jgi:energy-coupling factor transporter ATP-binding protein EcfA2
MSKLDLINDNFKLPIFYNKEKMNVKENIIQDLELVKTIDNSGNSIYNHFFSQEENRDDPVFSDIIMEQISQTYTTDIVFLKDSQNLLKSFSPKENTNTSNILTIWKEIKEDTSFKDKYHYIDWPLLEHLNKSDTFLQILSVYTMASPILSLLTPLILLIIPFFIIKMRGLTVSISDYMDIMKQVISNHALGKISHLFTDFNSISFEQKAYIFLSLGFYIFSIYQNISTCIKFHQNMIKIHKYFGIMNTYLKETIIKMNDLSNTVNGFSSYIEFNQVIKEKIIILENYQKKINVVGNFYFSFKKIMEIGHILKIFYEIFENVELTNAFLYSFGFHGYYQCLQGLKNHLISKSINYTTFTKKKGKNIFKKSYYCPLIQLQPIKNDIKLKENLIITGPNASGKTTILKTTLINILLSQQFGCGCYKSAKLYPYKFIHCYLNIPDTSGRDSLFQSEVRRCKEIIQSVIENSEDTHFCVFDELYSGTNPEEAITSSTAFMEYIVKCKNVFSMLTTHFIQVCHNLDLNKKILNYKMTVDKNTGKYTYILNPGISEVKGGVKVLYDMQYPKEILDKLKKNN